MFVAASTRCFVEKSFREACFLLDDMGFDKVELWFDAARKHLPLNEVLADVDGFVTRFRDATRLAPIAISLEADLPLAEFKSISRLAKQLRIAQITVPSAPLGTPFNSEVDRLRDLLRVGSEDGVLVSIKTLTGRLTEDPDTAVELCRAVPGLGITFDPSYLLCGPRHTEESEQSLPYIYHVNLRDSTPESIQVPAGLGQLDYSRLISQLERTNYRRALSIEILPELMPEADRPIELRKIRLLLESLL